ncbi:MAG: HAMP domain-containing histidine kinase [Clostridia bacterium]|nr:HAMP domain-containing histidine kinase [Clostridia bacterium]
MFKRTKKRIVTAITASLILFLAVILGAVYLSNYYQLRNENGNMLENYLRSYPDGAKPDGFRPDDRMDEPLPNDVKKPPVRDRHLYEISTFYAVEFDSDGNAVSVENRSGGPMSDDELIDIASEILKSGKSSGRTGVLSFMTESRNGASVVAMMDDTFTDASMKTLLKTALIAGGVSIVAIFLISLFLADRIVKPLEENDRRQKQFVSDAGHELKTPVSVISTNIDLLLRESGGSEWLSNIQYENERMGTLVTQLLDLSRAENASLPKEDTDLSRIVTGEVLPFESVAFEKGLTITSDVEDGVRAEGNATQLSQIVSILLDNAIRYSDGGNTIDVKLKPEHHSAVLSVTNSGREIPEEKLKHLFERFYRVDEARTADGDHYGLGLAIAKAIADAHRGVLSAVCRGGKITFTFSIPAKNP